MCSPSDTWRAKPPPDERREKRCLLPTMYRRLGRPFGGPPDLNKIICVIGIFAFLIGSPLLWFDLLALNPY